MNLHISPRMARIRTLAHSPNSAFLDKLNPLHTPTVSRIPRTPSLNDSRKPIKSPSYRTQKTVKLRQKTEVPYETLLKLQNSSSPSNMVINLVSEAKSQELRMLKHEVSTLKASIHQLTLEQSKQTESFHSSIDSLQKELNYAKNEYLKLFGFITEHSQIEQKIKVEAAELAYKSNLLVESANSWMLAMQKQYAGNPFDMAQSRKSVENTARFQSLAEFQPEDFGGAGPQAIVLEAVAGAEGFLQLAAGDRIEVLGRQDDELWIGRMNQKIGLFPRQAIFID
jgi:hypothetical protein